MTKKERNRIYYQNNKDKIQKRHKEYRNSERGKEVFRNSNLKYSYKISPEEYDSKLECQKDSCAICGVHKSEFSKPLYVDHNHQTGENRGLLCHNCNLMLGYSKDKPEVLRDAALYLEEYDAH